MSSFDVRTIRNDFPLLTSSKSTSEHDEQKKIQGIPCYFDSAATALKPNVVIDSITEYYREYSANVHRGTYSLSIRASEEYEQARDVVKKFLDADDSYEIIFTSGTSDAINYVALASEHHFNASDKKSTVTVSTLDHHSVFVPWQQVCQRSNSNFLVIPVLEDASLDLDLAKKYISTSNILCITGMSNVIGNTTPIGFFISEAQKNNCKIVIDAAQLLAHKKFSLKTHPVDAICFSGHKLCGPTGIGVLCIKKQWLQTFERIRVGGGTVETVTKDKTNFLTNAEGYEAGTPHIAGAIGLKAALEYIMNIGFNQIEEHEKKLRPLLVNAVKCIPQCKILGEEQHNKNKIDSAIVSFSSPKLHTQDISFLLQQQNIFIRTGFLCAQPLLKHFGLQSVARASCYFYNTREEIEQLHTSLQKLGNFL